MWPPAVRITAWLVLSWAKACWLHNLCQCPNYIQVTKSPFKWTKLQREVEVCARHCPLLCVQVPIIDRNKFKFINATLHVDGFGSVCFGNYYNQDMAIIFRSVLLWLTRQCLVSLGFNHHSDYCVCACGSEMGKCHWPCGCGPHLQGVCDPFHCVVSVCECFTGYPELVR